MCIATSDCENGTVQLYPVLNEREPNEGYVQLCINGGWKTLCGSNFFRVEADVVCRQLGYRDFGKASLYRAI